MAQPTTATGSKLSIWLGDGASPEVFAAPCGLRTRGINFTGNANDEIIPDCDDPDAPAWVARTIQSLQAGIRGSGLLAKEALDSWQGFYFGAASKNCRVIIDWGGGVNRRYDGGFVCTAFNVTGEQGSRIQVEIALDSDGVVTPVDVP